MGAEVGATTSVFPYTQSMSDYLRATNRHAIADLADQHYNFLSADEGAQYDEVIEIDLSTLEPHINGPHTPDLSTPISKMKEKAKEFNWPEELKVALIGSCTNSSYEDLSRAASIARQALENNLKAKSTFYITPGSEQIRATMKRDGYQELFERIGGVVLANVINYLIKIFFTKNRHVVHALDNGIERISKKEKIILLLVPLIEISVEEMMEIIQQIHF